MDRTFALGLDQSARGNGAEFKTRPDQRDSRLVGIWHEEHRPGNLVRYGSFIEEKLNTFHASIVTGDFGQAWRSPMRYVNVVKPIKQSALGYFRGFWYVFGVQ